VVRRRSAGLGRAARLTAAVAIAGTIAMTLSPTPVDRVEIRRAGSRAVTEAPGVRTAHAFSFGRHYDPADVGFGLLLAHNEELLAAGAGYPLHRHADVEIVTWMLSGSLVHQDAAGRRGLATPERPQRLTAGRGVEHSETNDAWRLRPGSPAHDRPARFLQMWLRPDEPGVPPGYEQRDVDRSALHGALVPVAAGLPHLVSDAALRLQQRRAALHVARLAAGDRVLLPDAPFVHVHVGLGRVELEEVGTLAAGDAARITGSTGRRLAGAGTEPAEVVVWEMHAER
jgi:redox-sensitive bicupin YhaK (pirin superfamily)